MEGKKKTHLKFKTQQKGSKTPQNRQWESNLCSFLENVTLPAEETDLIFKCHLYNINMSKRELKLYNLYITNA